MPWVSMSIEAGVRARWRYHTRSTHEGWGKEKPCRFLVSPWVDFVSDTLEMCTQSRRRAEGHNLRISASTKRGRTDNRPRPNRKTKFRCFEGGRQGANPEKHPPCKWTILTSMPWPETTRHEGIYYDGRICPLTTKIRKAQDKHIESSV